MWISIRPQRQSLHQKKKPQSSVFFVKTTYTDLGRLTTVTPFPEIKKPRSRIQSKVLTGWRSCTITLLMILCYHHLALLYNQGMLRRHLKLPEVVESICVNFSPQRQRGLMPSEFSNELPHQVKKAC